jgi:hypothetical protein
LCNGHVESFKSRIRDECLNINSSEAGVRGHQHWNTTTTINIDSAAKATNLRPAKLPQVPTNERLSFAVDQFTGSGHCPQFAAFP